MLSYTDEKEIEQYLDNQALTMADIRRVCWILRGGQTPPGDQDQMMHVRIRPLGPAGAPAHEVNRWAVDLGTFGNCEVKGEVDGNKWVAYQAAIDYVLAARQPLAHVFAGYGDVFGGVAAQVGRLASEWWRWPPPCLRVVQVGLEWDTLELLWRESRTLADPS